MLNRRWQKAKTTAKLPINVNQRSHIMEAIIFTFVLVEIYY
ncbi:hypothetical protein NWP21_03975 [Anabaenopsis sp. FSS-46]|nr:hypothetical protein [Anabaenopsis sp. FSS-46]MDH6098016.1 hypothetical protein [Anabaenopsis sp. FSS-46]